MIKRIELTNFMSHEHTVLEPAAGLTVLVGPNNCGKSAVVAALQILTNNIDSNYVMRHGCKECSVAVETDDGHRVEWRRKNAPSYLIDDTKFDRLGRGNVPAELAPALRLKKVEGTEDDIHFGEQKSPLFLIDKPPAHAARFFAASSDVSRLVAMQTRHRTKHNDAKKRKNELEAKSAQVTKELDALAPLTDLDQQLERQEAAYLELGRLEESLRAAIRLEAELVQSHRRLSEFTAATDALTPLSSPPALGPTTPLVQLLTNLNREQRTNDQESQRANVLIKLHPPPVLDDTEKLAKLNERLTTASRNLDVYQQRRSALATLAPLPQLADTAALESLILRLHEAMRAEQRAEGSLKSLGSLAPLPIIANELPLQAIVNAIEIGAKKLAQCERQVMALKRLEPSPNMNDPAPLVELLKQFDKQTSDLQRQERELSKAQADCRAAAQGLREWALEQQTCPTCGSALDPDRLLTTMRAGGPEGGAHA